MQYPMYQPYGGYNAPYQPYQPQRFDQQQAQLPAQPQPAAAPVQQQPGIIMRPVTSRAEAVASQIQFDGSTSYFINTSNDEIYSKTFNFSDGTAPLVTYVRETAPVAAIQYATLEDLNALREELTAKTRKTAKKDDADAE